MEQSMCAAFVFVRYMYAFAGVLSMVYAFMVLQGALTTVGVASLAPLASHRMATQCLSIIEVIKRSG